MKFDAFIEQLNTTASAIRTAYIIGKAEGNTRNVTLEEIGEIYLRFIEEYEDYSKKP